MNMFCPEMAVCSNKKPKTVKALLSLLGELGRVWSN